MPVFEREKKWQHNEAVAFDIALVNILSEMTRIDSSLFPNLKWINTKEDVEILEDTRSSQNFSDLTMKLTP